VKVSIVVTPDGRLSAITREGTFAEGKARLLELAAKLRAEGIEVPPLSDFEQHRHDREPVASRKRTGQVR
jgi:hypothetical protein